MSDILILGTGLAGYTLAREFRKLDATATLHLLTADDGSFYSKPAISNALAQKKTAAQLALNTAEQMAIQLKAVITTRVQATSIDPSAHSVVTATGAHGYRRLVLALGAEPIRLDTAGDGAGHVLSINNLADYARFRERLAGRQRVAILGAGLIGCEFANDLRAAGMEVDVIDPGANLLIRFLPTLSGRFLQNELEKSGVRFHLGTTAQSIGRLNQELQIDLANGTSLKADLVLSAVGLRPHTRLAAAAGIKTARGIVTDRALATNIPDIHALGDCAEVAGLNLPFVMPIMQAARALARTLSGTPTAVQYPAMPVVVKTPACPTVLCPPPPGVEGDWDETDTGGGIRALFHDRRGALRGFALTGHATGAKQALLKDLPALLG